MSYPYFTRENRIIGPACARYYDHHMVLDDQSMICEPDLRNKLSKAVSHLYFLHPHSIIVSQVEARPLIEYYDQTAYRNASLLYFGGSSPGRDLRNCLRLVQGKYEGILVLLILEFIYYLTHS
jgi:hypothetical protein